MRKKILHIHEIINVVIFIAVNQSFTYLLFLFKMWMKAWLQRLVSAKTYFTTSKSQDKLSWIRVGLHNTMISLTWEMRGWRMVSVVCQQGTLSGCWTVNSRHWYLLASCATCKPNHLGNSYRHQKKWFNYNIIETEISLNWTEFSKKKSNWSTPASRASCKSNNENYYRHQEKDSISNIR